MALLEILEAPDPRLSTVCQPVERIDADLLRLLDDMLETMHAAPGIGLAAPQVGQLRRACVVDLGKQGEGAPLFLINPEVIWRSNEIVIEEEGCLSLPEHFGQVARAEQVRVRFLDRAGAPQEIEGARPAGPLPAARDRPSERRPVRRSPLGAEAHPDPAQAPEGQAVAQPRQRLSPHALRSERPACQRPRAGSVFMGTADVRGAEPEGARRQPARGGRGLHPAGAAGRPRLAQPRPSPVQRAAEALAIPVRAPARLRDPADQAAFAALHADLAVVAAYGLILPQGDPGRAAARLHQPARLAAAALARRRADPARAAGGRPPRPAITIFQMEPSLDTGPVLASRSVPISDRSTAASLHDELAEVAAGMVVAAVDDLAAGPRAAGAAAGCGRHLCRQDREGGGPARLDAAGRKRSSASCARSIPGPAAGPSSASSDPRAGRPGGASRSRPRMPGEVLDERLTVACGDGGAGAHRGAAAGRPADAGRSVPARLRRACRHAAGPAMPRYKLTLEYDGGAVSRLAAPDGPAVGAAGAGGGRPRPSAARRCTVQAAGRTDAGVHALGQVAHLDLAREVALETLRNALNHHLRPRPVVVLEAAEVAADFHARFSARARHYRYLIVNRPAPLALERGHAWFVPGRLDAEVMHEAGLAPARPARLQQLSRRALPGQIAGQDARLDQRVAARRRGRDRRAGALLPAPSGAQHGRHAEAGRPAQMAGRADRGGAGGARPGGGRADRAGLRPLSRPGRLCGWRPGSR